MDPRREVIAVGAPPEWARWGHAIVGAPLLVATVLAVLGVSRGGPPGPGRSAAVVALAAALAGWYVTWVVRRRPALRDPRLRAWYLGGAGLLWLALVLVDHAFAALVVPAYVAVFGYLTRRWLPVGLAAVTGIVFVGEVVDPRGTFLDDLAVPAVALGVALAVGVPMRAIALQSRHRRHLIDELRATRDELAAAERAAGMLTERQRLAREIHDTLAQGFASVVVQLESAQVALDGAAVGARAPVTRALAAARDGLAEARRVVWALRPAALEGRSLPQALARLGENAGEDGTVTAVAVTGRERPLPVDAEVALLRAAQEALANVRRHAGASTVSVTLSYMEDLVVLDVRDDGCGFDPRTVRPVRPGGGAGLHGMRERVAELGGRLSVESAPGEGTAVVVELPVERVGEPA